MLTAPIRKLSRTAKQIAGGNYAVRAKVRTGDEIGVLAQQFNVMAEELEQHIASLEEATQKQRDFTASFAHELKTPLTSIIGYADTLRSRRLPEDQQFEAASFIFTEGRRLETMSHSLLRLFSLDTEQPELRPISALNLAKEVEESIAYPLRQRQQECGGHRTGRHAAGVKCNSGVDFRHKKRDDERQRVAGNQKTQD